MSFNKSSKSEELAKSEISVDERINEEELQLMRESINNDLNSLLKPNIDFGQELRQLMLKKNNTNKVLKKREINQRLDDLKTKISELNANENCETKVESNEMDLDLSDEQTKRLNLVLPTFKRMANTMSENCEKHSIESICNSCKIIDVNNQQIDNALEITTYLQSFQNASKLSNHLN